MKQILLKTPATHVVGVFIFLLSERYIVQFLK